MNRHAVTVIARKELRESLRDRRTLFLLIFLPLLLYPVLLVGFAQVALVAREKLEDERSVVGIIGADRDHPFVSALAGESGLDVVLLNSPDTPEQETGGAGAGAGENEGSGGAPGSGPESPGAADERPVAEVSVSLDLTQWPNALDADSQAVAELRFAGAQESSSLAADRVEDVFNRWQHEEVRRRLESRGLSERFIEPVALTRMDRSTERERGGAILGALLPLLVLTTVLIGAYYPAIDLTAGEKERGTIQTLFTAPIRVIDVVTGKYLAVLAISLISGGANLLSLSLVFGQNLVLNSDILEGVSFDMGPATIAVLAWAIFVMAALFSALLLAVAVMARSYKEAQSYITPVYVLCILPASLAQIPGVELTPAAALLPGINLALLMKQALIGGFTAQSLFLVTASSTVYTAIALHVAARLFGQESVIVGERAQMGLLLRRAAGSAPHGPRPGEGIAWYGVQFLLLYYVGATIQSRAPQAGLAVTLWLLVLAPTLVLARVQRLDFAETFSLRRPTLRALLASVILGVAAQALIAPIDALIESHWLPVPPEFAEEMARFFPEPDGAVDWVILLALVSVSPALCEEALFRGYLFSSLRGRVPPWALVGVTALLFGLFHMSVYRLFGTTTLGLFMGWLVLRTRSIWSSVTFHAVNNGVAITLAMSVPDSFGFAADAPPAWLPVAGAAGTALAVALLHRDRPEAVSTRG